MKTFKGQAGAADVFAAEQRGNNCANPECDLVLLEPLVCKCSHFAAADFTAYCSKACQAVHRPVHAADCERAKTLHALTRGGQFGRVVQVQGGGGGAEAGHGGEVQNNKLALKLSELRHISRDLTKQQLRNRKKKQRQRENRKQLEQHKVRGEGDDEEEGEDRETVEGPATAPDDKDRQADAFATFLSNAVELMDNPHKFKSKPTTIELPNGEVVNVTAFERQSLVFPVSLSAASSSSSTSSSSSPALLARPEQLDIEEAARDAANQARDARILAEQARIAEKPTKVKTKKRSSTLRPPLSSAAAAAAAAASMAARRRVQQEQSTMQ